MKHEHKWRRRFARFWWSTAWNVGDVFECEVKGCHEIGYGVP